MLPHRTQLMSTVLAQKQKSKPMKKIKDPNMSYIRRGKGGGGRGGRRREERESGRKKEGGGREGEGEGEGEHLQQMVLGKLDVHMKNN